MIDPGFVALIICQAGDLHHTLLHHSVRGTKYVVESEVGG